MKRFVYLAAFFLFVSCAKDIVDLTGDISGVVKDYTGGQFIENCKVSLSPGGKSTTTMSNGMYEFNDLQPGDYTLSFSKAGYNDESSSVTVVAGQVSNVSTMLRAKSAFALSETVLDFGDLESNKIFYAFNNSDADCSFTISNLPNWLRLSQVRGTVKAGSSESISATLDRGGVGYGDFSQTLNVAYSGKTSGSVSLIVRFSKVQLTKPKVSIEDKAENITQNSFAVNGTIEATGGSPVTSYGHCWSTSANPTVDDNKTTLGSTTSTGPFTSNITNLATFTTYYVRAYATNEQGTTYSQQISVTTKEVEGNKWDGEIAESFAGGRGTAADPYIIKTGGQLLLVKNYKTAYFELAGNIDLDNHNWLPIRDYGGSIDGKGYIISNLKIDRQENYIGLFSNVESRGTVKDITIKGVKINAAESDYVGPIAGYSSGVISGCNVYLTGDSEIYGKRYVGGIVGYCYADINNSTITSLMDNSIRGDSEVGGIVGSSDCGGNCSNCVAKTNIKARKDLGGIAGSTYGEIRDCEFAGSLKGESNIGGIVGRLASSSNKYSKVFRCKSSGSISVSNGSAGGVAGTSFGGEVISCYSNGEIIAPENVSTIAGLVGEGSNTGHCEIRHSYSTMSSDNDAFVGFAYTQNYAMTSAVESATTCSYGGFDVDYGGKKIAIRMDYCRLKCTDISIFMKECYSDHASDWNFKNTWVWEGVIDGEAVKVNCPKLVWE